jgi:hypothetical protein
VLVAASGAAGITLAAVTPASGQASCTGSTDVKGFGVLVSTIGNNTHRDNCELVSEPMIIAGACAGRGDIRE